MLLIKSDDLCDGTSSNGTIDLDFGKVFKENAYYELVEFAMSNSLYNVNAYNNNLPFSENSVDKSTTLTQSTYTASELATEIQTQMDASGNNTYTVTFDDKSGKFTIARATGVDSFGFTYGTNTSNTSRYLLGFDASDQTEGTTQTSDNVIDITPYKIIYFYFINNANIAGNSKFSASFSISGNGGFLEPIRYNKNEKYSQTVKFNSETAIEFRIVDKNNKIIDFHGASWEMILKRMD